MYPIYYDLICNLAGNFIIKIIYLHWPRTMVQKLHTLEFVICINFIIYKIVFHKIQYKLF